ncbi:hypothetical protein QUF51_11705 [Bacillus pumilus]|nr:hypothetical protein [Bacillus pumilus]OLP65486.1 hypothetical protein BACPU_15740 [Bacillus pumilus]
MKTGRLILLFLTILIFIVILPLLSPIFFTNATEKGAIRQFIYQAGYPYQSYFAIIQNKNHVDPQYGQLYHVTWQDWKSETGMTPSVCYSKKVDKKEYKISCGTAP